MSTLLTRKFEKGFTLGLDFKRLLLPDLAQDSSEDSYDPNDIEFDEDENHFSFNGVFLWCTNDQNDDPYLLIHKIFFEP